jgi:hypothetical protein
MRGAADILRTFRKRRFGMVFLYGRRAGQAGDRGREGYHPAPCVGAGPAAGRGAVVVLEDGGIACDAAPRPAPITALSAITGIDRKRFYEIMI